jgi:hypothetical protein
MMRRGCVLLARNAINQLHEETERRDKRSIFGFLSTSRSPDSSLVVRLGKENLGLEKTLQAAQLAHARDGGANASGSRN